MSRTKEELEIIEERYEKIFRGKKDLLNKQIADLKSGKALKLNGNDLMTLLLWIDRDREWDMFGLFGYRNYKIKYINGDYKLWDLIDQDVNVMTTDSLIWDLESKIEQGAKPRYYYEKLKEQYEWKKENKVITDKELKRLEEIKEILNT